LLGVLTMLENLVGRSILEARLTASVLIVGGGPCGLMLAGELGRRGVSVVMTDEKPMTPFEADDVADTRDRNVWLDRELRQDAPLRDIHGETRRVVQGRAARQLVDDEGERWNAAIDIEHPFDLRVLACRGEAQIARLSVPAHGLPSLVAPFEIGTSRTALEEQTAGGSQ
jgi:hypothetical protein